MRLTVTGPSSVGKSEVADMLAERLDVDYISPLFLHRYQSNNGNGALFRAANLFYEGNKTGFVIDMPSTMTFSREYPSASSRLRLNAKQNSIVIGLIPYSSPKRAVDLIFRRTRENPEFRNIPSKELRAKLWDEYKDLPLLLKDFCNMVVHVRDQYPERVADEILRRLSPQPTKRGRPKKQIPQHLRS